MVDTEDHTVKLPGTVDASCAGKRVSPKEFPKPTANGFMLLHH